MFMLLLLLLVTIFILGYIFVHRRFSYWSNRNVPYIKPRFPYGTHKFGMAAGTRVAEAYLQMKGKGPFLGMYNFFTPDIIALDLDFIKTILVKDFNHFTDRGVYYNPKDEPMTSTLFHIEGDKWKNLRSKLSPTFTSGKMKQMFPIVFGIANNLFDAINEKVERSEEIEMNDISTRYTTDVIASCAFGLECNSLKDSDAKFRQMGVKFFKEPRNPRWVQLFLLAHRELGRKLGFKLVADDISLFFKNIVYDTVEYRLQNGVTRNDFMDLLIKMRNKNKSNNEADTDMDGLSMDEVAAQSIVFLFAGLETSSTAVPFALYELSKQPELQDKARKCVKETLEMHNGEFTYDSVQNMAYVGQCIDEALRMYPPVSALLRIVTEDYKVPNMNVILPKGMMVTVPTIGLHYDPEIYSDPKKFDPDRFSLEEIQKRNPYAYMAFGEGPRYCIGNRFALMQARVALATLLNSFRFKLNSKTPIKLTMDTTSLVFCAQNPLIFDVERI